MAKNIELGGPAFPATDGGLNTSFGMTLLDYFAGQALAGDLANPGRSNDEPAFMSMRCYNIAANMLAERKKRMGN